MAGSEELALELIADFREQVENDTSLPEAKNVIYTPQKVSPKSERDAPVEKKIVEADINSNGKEGIEDQEDIDIAEKTDAAPCVKIICVDPEPETSNIAVSDLTRSGPVLILEDVLKEKQLQLAGFP